MKAKKNLILSASISVILIIVLAVTLTYTLSHINLQTIEIRSLMPRYNFNELITNSHVIVKGQITGDADVFTVRPANGADDSVFTQYQFEVDDVIRGDVTEGETIGIRFQGGQNGNLRVINFSEEIDLNDNEQLVLFLRRVTVGGALATNDEYYIIVGGGGQGIFYLDEDAEAETYVSDSTDYDPLVWSTARAQLVELANELPTNQSGLLEYEIEELKAELESGKITQDEYDTTLESYTKYATIID